MLCQLAQSEFTVKKSEFTAKMMENELKNYAAISRTIDVGIEHAKVQIDQSKQNLILAKQIRKHRMEYDALAKVINQEPDRKETAIKLETLNRELEQLKENRCELEQRLESRRNEFTVLMRSIQELQCKYENQYGFNEESDEHMENGTSDESNQVESMSVDDDVGDYVQRTVNGIPDRVVRGEDDGSVSSDDDDAEEDGEIGIDGEEETNGDVNGGTDDETNDAAAESDDNSKSPDSPAND